VKTVRSASAILRVFLQIAATAARTAAISTVVAAAPLAVTGKWRRNIRQTTTTTTTTTWAGVLHGVSRALILLPAKALRLYEHGAMAKTV